MLQFICSYFNFSDSVKIKQNYIKFRQKFPYPITTVELALPHQDFFIDDSIKIRAGLNNLLWQKERCLNIAIENLPSNTDSIAWIDTDIIFSNPDLLPKTYDALDKYKAVQLFDKCYERPAVNPYNNTISLGKQIVDNLEINFPAIGFCWAFRKEILIDNKLYDSDPVGNSDVLQMLAWRGKWNHKTIIQLAPEHKKDFLLWAWDSYVNVQDDIGYVPGSIEHLYHGHHVYRQYNSRNNILIKHNYSPSQDLRIDSNGLYSIPYKQQLISDIKRYFMIRTKYE